MTKQLRFSYEKKNSIDNFIYFCDEFAKIERISNVYASQIVRLGFLQPLYVAAEIRTHVRRVAPSTRGTPPTELPEIIYILN